MLQVKISPTSFLDQGIRVEDVDGLRLFKFTDAFQERLEALLERNQTNALSNEEVTELDGLTEVDRFFTYLNSRLIAQA